MSSKMFYFKGRNTPIIAESASAARAKKKRGGDEIVSVRKPSAADKMTISRGGWVRTRKDGKSPEKSTYGKGRGYGPPRT